MTAIEIRNLRKVYGKKVAVDNLCLDIRQGEVFALLGVNGAGKTTTIKMLATLAAPTAGDATLLGHSVVKDAPGVKKVIALSPQETALAQNLTVAENLAFMAGVQGKPKEQIKKITEDFGLFPVLGQKAKTLSGGWQRRLSIALALLSEPQILFLDEPTLGLDVLARAELWDIIRALPQTVTVILTTHYMEEAEALADRIGVMKDGKLRFAGTAAQMKAQTATDSVEQAFIALVKEGAT